jgi:hypothetical protein
MSINNKHCPSPMPVLQRVHFLFQFSIGLEKSKPLFVTAVRAKVHHQKGFVCQVSSKRAGATGQHSPSKKIACTGIVD